jgi:thiol-disulfide isomerase/thioredoxin
LQRSDDAAPDRAHGRGVRLVNRGNGLSLKRLRIARWLGKTPSMSHDGQASIVMSDRGILSGTINHYDGESDSLMIAEGDRQIPIKMKDVIAIKLAASPTSDQPAQCALFLQGGTRLSGDLKAIDSKHWIVSGSHLVGEVRIPRDRVRSMIVFQHNGVDLDPGLQLGRLGRLELGPHKLSGRLAAASVTPDESAPTTDSSCLHWHPLGSDNAVPLQRTASGRIVYEEPTKRSASSTAARALAMQRLRLQQQNRGLNFGKLFLERVDNVAAKAVERNAHVIHIRAGDVVACRIESIDDSGVHLTTVDSDKGFVPHAQVKAIELVTNAPPPDLHEAKRMRLLTIPRLQKSSPPTHLICSHTGDYLRCRLRHVDAETVSIEVQLEEITIPRERVAQIIWFHPDEIPVATESESESSPDVESAGPGAAVVDGTSFDGTSFDGMAQVLHSDGRRVTFVPSEITEKIVAGSSELLGACRFDLFKVDQLIFGSRIATEVSDVAFNRWKLHPAVEPLVAQISADGPDVGSESPLIGLDAPELQLDLLGGGQFTLSEYQGRVVVLDFWASWCAPCMQTMPLLEEAIDDFDSDQVRLISINLEEPADHIRSVIDRHGMNLTVALDIDGVAAARYQARAIPQLVIIGPGGKVRRLYVGGGGGVIKQMKTAIAELIE